MATYTLISSVTVGSGGAASIGFSSIPSTFTDLQIFISARTNATEASGGYYNTVKFNGVSTNITSRYLYGTGAGAGSGNASDIYTYNAPSNYTASTFASTSIYIPNYTSANYKSVSIDDVIETNATGSPSELLAGLWSNTAAITQIDFTPAGGSFVQYSTAYLYGISNA